VIYDKLCEYGLVARCDVLPARPATEEEILTYHDDILYTKILSTKGCEDEKVFQSLSEHHDDVYFNANTFEAASLSAGACIELTEMVAKGRAKNGFALVRPPGHHAMKSDFCGFCIFNNCVLAAKHALENLGCCRVLIIDWDIHHGQGTQYAFYDDPRVLYVSIHRYEFGEFWPRLR
jgi:histone deacetylase 6